MSSKRLVDGTYGQEASSIHISPPAAPLVWMHALSASEHAGKGVGGVRLSLLDVTHDSPGNGAEILCGALHACDDFLSISSTPLDPPSCWG